MFRTLNTAMDNFFSFQQAIENTMGADYFEHSTTCRGSYPGINIFQDGENTVVTAELAGFKKDDIKIEVKENLLRLSGERDLDYPEGGSVHRLERSRKVFDRTVKLPHKVELDQIKADFKNGILTITLPKAESEKPREIKIA